MKFFNPTIVKTRKNGDLVTDQHGNANPYIRGEVRIVGLNTTFKSATMKKLEMTEAQFLERFTSSTGYVSRFYDIEGEDGSVTMAIMSEKVIENAGREPKEGQKWTTTLSRRLNEQGQPKVDANGRPRMSFTIVGAPIVDLGNVFDDMFTELTGEAQEQVEEAPAAASVAKKANGATA